MIKHHNLNVKYLTPNIIYTILQPTREHYCVASDPEHPLLNDKGLLMFGTFGNTQQNNLYIL